MTLLNDHLLSLILFTPLAGAILLLFVSGKQVNAIRWIANIVGTLGFLVSVPLWFRYDPAGSTWQFVERAEWISSIGASYYLGVDGFSVLLILLTTLMGTIAILSSWSAITERVKEFYIFMLVLQTGMLGAFVSLDFLLFFLFWEVMLVPMYFLIGIWGGGRRLYSAIKFFIYTLVGSVVMLLGILALYFHHHAVTGIYSFDIGQFQQMSVPVLGVIENMSYFDCPGCGQRHDIFGSGGSRFAAEQLGLRVLATLPLEPVVRAGGDEGRPAVLDTNSRVGLALRQAAETLYATLPESAADVVAA